MTCQLAALCKRALSRLSWTRAVSFPKLTGFCPTFHTDTPDVERLAQVLSERLLISWFAYAFLNHYAGVE